MPVPTLITALSPAAAANSPPGAESIGTQMNDYVQAAFAFIAQLRDDKSSLTVANVFAGAATFQGQLAAVGGVIIGDNAGDSFSINSYIANVPNGLAFQGYNVGVGAFLPTWKFTVQFDGTLVNGLQVNDTATAGSPYLLQLVKQGAEKMRVSATGDVHAKSVNFTSPGVGVTFLSATNSVDADFVMGLSPPGPNKYTTIGSFSSNSLDFMTSNVVRFRVSGTGPLYEMQADGPRELGYKGLPFASVSSGAFNAIDHGRCVYAIGNITVPNGVMGATDVVAIQNTTPGNITIFATATLRMTGTTLTGNRTLGPYGYAFILFENTSLAYISGSGLS